MPAVVRRRESPPKEEWGPGPWQDEPDIAQWAHAGLVCYARRNIEVTGAWCGYVGVPSTHPFWGKAYHECPLECQPDLPPEPLKPGDPLYAVSDSLRRISERFDTGHYSCRHTPEDVLRVHGGLTFASHAYWELTDPTHADLWYLGFDCGHFNDISPGMDAILRRIMPESPILPENRGQYQWAGFESAYRDLPYVITECNQLAEQLALVRDVEALRARSADH